MDSDTLTFPSLLEPSYKWTEISRSGPSVFGYIPKPLICNKNSYQDTRSWNKAKNTWFTSAEFSPNDGPKTYDVTPRHSPERFNKHLTSPRRSDPSDAIREAYDPNTITYPITPTEALMYFGDRLTAYERNEIRNYARIWFLGLGSTKHIGDEDDEDDDNNYGFDDNRGFYKIPQYDHLAYRYEILNAMGYGSFGEVVKALDHSNNQFVAIKIIKNTPRARRYALTEAHILDHVHQKDVDDSHSIVRMVDHFFFRKHLCISFELMNLTMDEFIEAYGYWGLPPNLVRNFAVSIMQCIHLLHKENIIHADIKPENIMLKNPGGTKIKVIDFGIACYTHEKVHLNFEEKTYRAPEIILGLPWGREIDMWNLGCTLVELATGRPVFAGENTEETLVRMIEVLGLPPEDMVYYSSERDQFFDSDGLPTFLSNSHSIERTARAKGLGSLPNCDNRLFLDFVSRCLQWNPRKRLTAEAAMQHMYITEWDDQSASHLLNDYFNVPFKIQSSSEKAKEMYYKRVATKAKNFFIMGNCNSTPKVQSDTEESSVVSRVTKAGSKLRKRNSKSQFRSLWSYRGNRSRVPGDKGNKDVK